MKCQKIPANKSAILVHYYFPSDYYGNNEFIPLIFNDKNGNEYRTNSIIKWGSDYDYEELAMNFALLKEYFLDKGIPIIIGEAGIITNYNNITSFMEFIYALFSLSYEYFGIMPCLWDSTKYSENKYYFNRETGKWNGEIIKNIILKTSKGKIIKSSEFYVKKKIENVKIDDNFWVINILNKKIVKIYINAKLLGKLGKDIDFGFEYFDKNDELFEFIIKKENGKKQYDGTTIFTIDLHNEIVNNYVYGIIYYGYEYIIINNITAEYDEELFIFDYKSYKEAFLNELS